MGACVSLSRIPCALFLFSSYFFDAFLLDKKYIFSTPAVSPSSPINRHYQILFTMKNIYFYENKYFCS